MYSSFNLPKCRFKDIRLNVIRCCGSMCEADVWTCTNAHGHKCSSWWNVASEQLSQKIHWRHSVIDVFKCERGHVWPNCANVAYISCACKWILRTFFAEWWWRQEYLINLQRGYWSNSIWNQQQMCTYTTTLLAERVNSLRVRNTYIDGTLRDWIETKWNNILNF